MDYEYSKEEILKNLNLNTTRKEQELVKSLYFPP